MSSTRVDRDARLADVARDPRMVAVVAAVGREIERDRQPGLAGGEVAPVEGVGFARRSRSRRTGGCVQGRCAYIVARGPRRYGGRPGRPPHASRALEIGRGVERLDRDALGRRPGQPRRAALGLLVGQRLPVGRARAAGPRPSAQPLARGASRATPTMWGRPGIGQTAAGARRAPPSASAVDRVVQPVGDPAVALAVAAVLSALEASSGGAEADPQRAQPRQALPGRPGLEGAADEDRHRRHAGALEQQAGAGQEAMQPAIGRARALGEPDQSASPRSSAARPSGRVEVRPRSGSTGRTRQARLNSRVSGPRNSRPVQPAQ